MIEIRQSEKFATWMDGLRDERARAKITVRLRRLSLGNPGDVKPVGEGVGEMRIDCGPGYRLYFVGRGAHVIVLLCGGDKTTQARDIEDAKAMAKSLKESSDGD